MMARLDRCEYCDYCRETGSEYADISPGQNGEVRLRANGAFLCDPCWKTEGRPTASILTDDIYDDDLLRHSDEDDETTPALSEL